MANGLNERIVSLAVDPCLHSMQKRKKKVELLAHLKLKSVSIHP